MKFQKISKKQQTNEQFLMYVKCSSFWFAHFGTGAQILSVYTCISLDWLFVQFVHIYSFFFSFLFKSIILVSVTNFDISISKNRFFLVEPNGIRLCNWLNLISFSFNLRISSWKKCFLEKKKHQHILSNESDSKNLIRNSNNSKLQVQARQHRNFKH